MRTRFDVYHEVFDKENPEEYFEKEFKPHGFTLDYERQEVYKDFETEIQLNEGDRVDFFGIRRVSWKCYNPVLDMIVYEVLLEDKYLIVNDH